MVKGTSHRVVLVRFPDTRTFEQAIFIVREDTNQGVSSQELLREACVVAENYVQRRAGRVKKRLAASLCCAVGGGAAVGLAWLLTSVL